MDTLPSITREKALGVQPNKRLALSQAFTIACYNRLTFRAQQYRSGKHPTVTITRHKHTRANHRRMAPLPDKWETRGSTRAEGRTAGTKAAPGETRATRGKYTTALGAFENEHIFEDVWDLPDPELLDDFVEGDAVDAVLRAVEEEADRWSMPACILATSLRSLASIPEMVCCCFLVLVGS